MLLVTPGLYSASYKAFMALRLKPLVPFLKFVALILFVNCSSAVLNIGLQGTQIASHQTHRQQNNAAPTASYIDEPLEQLLQTIPEIKTLQPGPDQTQLAMILEHSGKNVDTEFLNFGDLVAKEIVSEIRANPTTDPAGQPHIHPNEPNLFQDEYSYFIVREGTLVQTRIREYRRNRYGSDGAKPIAAPLLATVQGMTFLSANFASSLLYFSSDLQREERFRYLGEQQLGIRTAYVVAFAQVPGLATAAITMRMTDGEKREKSNWLVQGIAWIDKSTFEILQMRTDLLARFNLMPPCGQNQDQLQTLIQFAPVQPHGVPDVMWLPTEANVHERLSDCKNPVQQLARNVHNFSEYRRYEHEEANVATPKETAAGSAYVPELVVHPYLEEPVNELIKRIPELEGIRPAVDQQTLPMILAKTGAKVTEFFDNLVDLIAHEEITQEQLRSSGAILASEAVEDSYLILRHGSKKGTDIDEYRMDKKGNKMDEVGLDKGFFVTSGFALSSVHFLTWFQWDSRFLYLGDQKIGGRDTYVVAYAQLPKEARIKVTLKGPRGATVRMLTQGIVWVDKRNFQILRMRTDLLARQPEIGLDEQTTKVKFVEVHLADLATPLWLPHEVTVYVKFGKFSDQHFEVAFKNVHHYTNYRRYRVATKMLIPQ